VPVALGFLMLVGSRDLRTIVHRCLWCVMGTAVIGVVSLAHGYKVGWDQYWFATVTFRTRYQSTAASSSEYGWSAFQSLLDIESTLLLAVVIAIAWHWWTLKRGHSAVPRTPETRQGVMLISIWLVGSLVGIAMGGEWAPHYLIQIVAPLSIWLGSVVASARERLTGGLSWVPAVLVLLLILESPLSVVVDGHGDPDVISQQVAGPIYGASQAIATYVQANTAPDDQIYVVATGPQIYFLADRRAAFRYLHSNEIRAYPPAYDELVALIESPSRPELIVDLDSPCRCELPNGGKAFWEQVERYYRFETNVEGYSIYRTS
jgi:hypothetical protein